MIRKTDSMRHNVPTVYLRIKASLIDYLVILAWMATIGLVGSVISLVSGGYPDYLGMLGPIGTQYIFFFVLTLPVGMYLYITESGAKHASLGKRKVGIQVIARDGGLPSKLSIFIRTIVKLLPWEIAHTFMWQMQYVFYQSGYETDIPVWIFIGMNVSTILIIVYLAMITIRSDSRGPHDIIAGTRVEYR